MRWHEKIWKKNMRSLKITLIESEQRIIKKKKQKKKCVSFDAQHDDCRNRFALQHQFNFLQWLCMCPQYIDYAREVGKLMRENKICTIIFCVIRNKRFPLIMLLIDDFIHAVLDRSKNRNKNRKQISSSLINVQHSLTQQLQILRFIHSLDNISFLSSFFFFLLLWLSKHIQPLTILFKWWS